MGKHKQKSTYDFIYDLTNALYNLFDMFYCNTESTVSVSCVNFYNNYKPDDEVVTFKYKFHIIVNDTLYVYDGWCYEEDIPKIPLGIYSHWLLTNYKLYEGDGSAFLTLYACEPNVVRKEKI